jgi:hypothetical protein
MEQQPETFPVILETTLTYTSNSGLHQNMRLEIQFLLPLFIEVAVRQHISKAILQRIA